MKQPVRHGGRSSRRLRAVALLGLPLSFGAVWLAPIATRWLAGEEVAGAMPAAVDSAAEAGTSSPPALHLQQGSATKAAVPLAPVAGLPEWQRAVRSSQPSVRAEALAGLATAPREQALPILQDLLKDGAYPDRQMVIESLAIMARLQGDADERIRTAFRVEIYDGSDEATSASAQLALADLEEDLR